VILSGGDEHRLGLCFGSLYTRKFDDPRGITSACLDARRVEHNHSAPNITRGVARIGPIVELHLLHATKSTTAHTMAIAMTMTMAMTVVTGAFSRGRGAGLAAQKDV
jgi:hypothetical protein